MPSGLKKCNDITLKSPDDFDCPLTAFEKILVITYRQTINFSLVKSHFECRRLVVHAIYKNIYAAIETGTTS